MITVHNLQKTYRSLGGDVCAVAGISFDVDAGEVFGLLGPNGAGKSTTIGMLTTSIAPTAGIAAVGGHDVATDPIGARAVSAVVFQDPSLDRSLTGRRNLEIHARLWGLDRATTDSRIATLAGRLELLEVIDRAPDSCSGGQRRRIEIARSLLSQPSVLFLDEPTVGLDPRIRLELLGVIADLRASTDITILLTTHYLDEAERLCDRIGIMHSGRLVAIDTPGALLARLGESIVDVRVDDVAVALRQLRDSGLAGADAFSVGNTLTVPLHDVPTAAAIASLDALGFGPRSVATRQPTLDDVYLSLTGELLAA
jgi:ABC-2 type transport system ATP-binding protein